MSNTGPIRFVGGSKHNQFIPIANWPSEIRFREYEKVNRPQGITGVAWTEEIYSLNRIMFRSAVFFEYHLASTIKSLDGSVKQCPRPPVIIDDLED